LTLNFAGNVQLCMVYSVLWSQFRGANCSPIVFFCCWDLSVKNRHVQHVCNWMVLLWATLDVNCVV